MPTANFYLKKDSKTKERALIILQMKYSGQRLVYSTGESIEVKNWNTKKQRVKNNNQTTSDGTHSLNDLLNELGGLAESTYRGLLKTGVPTPGQIKDVLINFMNQNKDADRQNKSKPTLFDLIDRFISGEIKTKGKTKEKNTLQGYHTTKTRLLDFQEKTKYPVDFETIDLDFFYKFINHLSKPSKFKVRDGTKKGKTIELKPLSQNSKAKQIQYLKTFMNEAIDLGYTNNMKFKHKKFSVSVEETDSVYLTPDELMQLYKTPMNPRLERARDLFLVGCCTGLRYGDFSTIRPENIVNIDGELFIKKDKTQKTKEPVIIPCDPIVLEIFEKYSAEKNRLPRSLSNSKLNLYIKEACKLAGLVESGRRQEDPEAELYSLVTTHTARRSFATNWYLEGFPTIELMKITGHKTESSFLKYIKVSKLVAAKKLSAQMRIVWSNKLLKAV
jgi:integrase